VKTSFKFLQIIPVVILVALASSCGGTGSPSGSTGTSGSGGTGGSTANNVAQLIVDAGPGGIGTVDLAFTTVTVCVPGTTNCQTIDHVQVDTGSEGLRVLSSVLTLPLPQQSSSGNTAFECTQFADLTFLWGPLAAADIKIAGESASSVPIQIVNPVTASPAAPTDCSSSQSGQQLTQDSTVFDLGANALIGIGAFRQDCGGACAVSVIPGTYYACNLTGCANAAQSVTAQVQNPVWMFASDNNGTILQFPAIPDAGQGTASGSLIFGIGTQSNNGLGSAVVLPVDSTSANFTVQFQNTRFTDVNFIDSGSNGYFFLDSATLTNPPFNIPMPDCPNSSSLQGFYCPNPTVPLSASLIGSTASGTPIGAARTVNFNVGSAQTLLSTSGTAFDDLGGESSGNFDFGLPFFFGKSVYTAIEGQNTPVGTGPYFAF
jgi:Protein of unknown function (DUF3443)